jgi:hypothetical protein
MGIDEEKKKRRNTLQIFQINESTTYHVVRCYQISKRLAVSEEKITSTDKKFIDMLEKE